MATKRVTIKAYGQTFQLTHDTGNQWRVSAVMPDTSSYNEDEHYYPVTVEAEDEAGNVTTKTVDDPTLGEKLKLYVKEITAPVITISSPTQGTKTSNKRPPVVFTVTDNDSGVDESTVKLVLGGQTYTTANFTKEAVSGGYKYTYTPTADLADDEYTATVSASDNDGNAATPKSVTFEVYAAAPTLSVTSPAEDGVTNKNTLQYAATTNGAELVVTVNGEPQTVNLSGGTATGTLTLTEGTNTIISTAKSETGVATEVTRVITLDTQPPQITDITYSEDNPTVGSTVIITVTVED
jgi:hypothetical protein